MLSRSTKIHYCAALSGVHPSKPRFDKDAGALRKREKQATAKPCADPFPPLPSLPLLYLHLSYLPLPYLLFPSLTLPYLTFPLLFHPGMVWYF